jgi:tripartite-type tricarboxylate transporter receptor subunit TctC
MTRLPRRLLLSLLAGLALAGSALADTWPAKPIRLVVNFPPGGAADAMARALGPHLSEALKQPLVIENKPGAGGNIGGLEVARAAGDGYTFLMSSGGAITINPLIYTKMGYDPEKELVPVAAVARVLVYLEVNDALPVKTVQDFIAYAKANPGKLSYGTPGQGSSPHLAAEMFDRMAGVKTTHVPYKGAGPALIDVLNGQLNFWFDPGPGLKHLKEGKIRLLAIGSPKRSPLFPDVPTLDEAGLKGFNADTMFGIYAPKGTPAAVLARVHDEVNKALVRPEVVQVLRALGAEAAPMSREAFVEHQDHERERFGSLVKAIGLRLD